MNDVWRLWAVWNGGGFMWIIWIVVIVVVVLLIRGGSDRGKNSPPAADTALEILRKRFANGEISEQEFEQRREVLERQ